MGFFKATCTSKTLVLLGYTDDTCTTATTDEVFETETRTSTCTPEEDAPRRRLKSARRMTGKGGSHKVASCGEMDCTGTDRMDLTCTAMAIVEEEENNSSSDNANVAVLSAGTLAVAAASLTM